MAYTKAGAQAVQRYTQKNYDQIKFVVKKGQRDRIKEYCTANGESLNAYIVRLIEEDMSAHGTQFQEE
jgi:hypothetical protein